MRFHSLPDSQRYPTSDAELGEVLSRYRAVLEQVDPGHPLVLLIEDYPAGDLVAGWRNRFFPEAELWREDATTSWWTESVSPESLDPVLVAIADDDRVGRLVITDETLCWRLQPYDGGLDVIARTPAARDALAARFATWLSPRDDGL